MKAKRVNKEREGEEEAWINNHPPRSTIIHQDQQPSTKMWKAACFPEVMCGSAGFPPRRTRQGARSQSLSRWLSLFFISGEAYK